MRILVVCIGVCVCSGCFSQDFKQRLLAMRAESAGSDKLKVEMEIKVYDNPQTKTPFFNQTAVVKRQGQNYFYRISGTEMLMNEKYLLMIDEPARQIICSERSVKQESKFVDPLTANLDSILNLYQTPILIDDSGEDTEHYQIAFNLASIKSIDLYIDKQENWVKRIAYVYEDSQLAVITFTMFDRNPAFAEHEFDEAQYILIEKGRMKTTPKYSRFNLALN